MENQINSKENQGAINHLKIKTKKNKRNKFVKKIQNKLSQPWLLKIILKTQIL